MITRLNRAAQYVGRERHSERAQQEEEAVGGNCNAAPIVEHEGSTQEGSEDCAKFCGPDNDLLVCFGRVQVVSYVEEGPRNQAQVVSVCGHASRVRWVPGHRLQNYP